MLRYLLLLPLIFCINIFAEVSLSSPKIKLNDKDQRIIEFKIENESINDGDIILNEYKTNNPIDESFIAYTLINDYGNYQTFSIILDDEYTNLLVQIIDSSTGNIQSTELTIFRDSTDIFTLSK